MRDELSKLWTTEDYWVVWFGLEPLSTPTIGVAVNVPLGYFPSTVVFSRFWSNISSLM